MESNVLQKRWVQGSNVVVDDLHGTAFTGEAGAHTFQISGVDSAQETVAITGTITGRFLTATNVTVPLTGSISDGVASVTLTEDCYVIPGRFVLSIYATNGSTTQCIYCGVGNVFRTQSDIIEYPSASIPDIEQIIADAQAAVTEINADVAAAQAAVAAAQTAVDGIEDQRQTMIASIASVAGQGTDTTLTQSGVAADAKAAGDQISDLKSALKASEIYYFDDFSKLTNKWIRDTGVIGDATTYNVGYIQCKANTKYTVIDDAGGGLRLSYTNVVPAVTVQTYGLQINNGSVSITTGADATYLTFQYLKTSTTIFVLEVDKDYQFTRKQDVKALTYKNAERILSGSDLNDYKTPGNYWVGSGADASSISNTPSLMSANAGRLTVTTLNNVNAIMQQYQTTAFTPTNLNTAIRLFSSGAWTEWKYIATNGYIDNAISQYTSNYAELLDYSKGATRILSGADFNDYKTPGNYWVGSGAAASGISNIAYPLAGRLTVTTLNNAMAVYQEYVTTSVQPNGVCKAWRLYSANTWTSWHIVASEEAIQIINRDSIVLYDKMALAGVSSAIDNLRKKMPYSIEFANATSPLWLVNYANNTQNCHPKVLYFDSGFGGHKYWMAYTPYPYCNDDYENPCVAYSNDGYHFVNIKGNPLDDPKGNGYNSDTHLVYNTNTGKMELWWRYVNDSTPQETIYRMLSDDGITWSAKEIVYNNTSGTQTNFESPSVIYENGIYKIWVCTYQNGVVYYEAPENNITSWQQIRQFPFQIQDEGINVRPWHIDVIKENNKYIMAIMCRNGVNLANNICSVFLALSDDNVTYETPYKVISGNVGVWDKVLYRTSIVKVPNGYRLYYTGETGATTTIYGDARWGLGISESNSLTNFYGVCKDTRVE